MKKILIFSSLVVTVILFLLVNSKLSYDSPSGYLHKDLSEQMDALAIFQGAIGEEIKRGKPENSLWLVDGLDSVLLLITERLNNHKNLIKPFDHYYETKMKEPVNMLRIAILNNDTAASHTAYKLLVKKCNSCHNLHEVEERAHY